MLQIDVGIKGVAPGYNTQQFLQQKVRQCKFWGGLALAGLAVTAHLFDQLCLNVVGTTLATTSLVIIVGAVLQTSRQVGSNKQQQLFHSAHKLCCFMRPSHHCCCDAVLLVYTPRSRASTQRCSCIDLGGTHIVTPSSSMLCSPTYACLVFMHVCLKVIVSLVLLLQVESLLEGPRLQHKLDNERTIIQSLNMM